MPIFNKLFAISEAIGTTTGCGLGAFGCHNNRSQLIRLYKTSYKCFDLNEINTYTQQHI